MMDVFLRRKNRLRERRSNRNIVEVDGKLKMEADTRVWAPSMKEIYGATKRSWKRREGRILPHVHDISWLYILSLELLNILLLQTTRLWCFGYVVLETKTPYFHFFYWMLTMCQAFHMALFRQSSWFLKNV